MTEAIIEKPAKEVYALIDWATPRNSRRALEDKIISFEEARTFLSEDGHNPRIIRDRGYRGPVRTVPTASPAKSCSRIGRLTTSHEHCSFEPFGTNSCRVGLQTHAGFAERLRMKDFRQELLKMTVACHTALATIPPRSEKHHLALMTLIPASDRLTTDTARRQGDGGEQG
jgi:hypothetical protein